LCAEGEHREGDERLVGVVAREEPELDDAFPIAATSPTMRPNWLPAKVSPPEMISSRPQANSIQPHVSRSFVIGS